MRRLLRWSLVTLAALLGASFVANRQPLPPDRIAMLTDRLLEFATVDFVHGGYDGPEKPLFDCVAAGAVLDAEQSRRYRLAYQEYLLSKQSLFRRLDSDLRLETDLGMARHNTVAGQGIGGTHDHHDGSMWANAADMERALTQLETSGPLRRAWLANGVYKDLLDLMVHMAPAVHSVGLHSDPATRHMRDDSSPIGQFYTAMKAAQEAPINSPAYWQSLAQAEAAYIAQIKVVQSRIRTRNGAILHALSGNWLALQTVAPRLGTRSPSAAQRRAGGGQSCDLSSAMIIGPGENAPVSALVVSARR